VPNHISEHRLKIVYFIRLVRRFITVTKVKWKLLYHCIVDKICVIIAHKNTIEDHSVMENYFEENYKK